MSRPTCSTLNTTVVISSTGLSPAMVILSRMFDYKYCYLVKAAPGSLAATAGISVDFFSSSYLDVSVRPVRLAALCIHAAIPVNRWVSPFGNLRINVYLPTPRSLSQAITSFIACDRQGIHPVHLVT